MIARRRVPVPLPKSIDHPDWPVGAIVIQGAGKINWRITRVFEDRGGLTLEVTRHAVVVVDGEPKPVHGGALRCFKAEDCWRKAVAA